MLHEGLMFSLHLTCSAMDNVRTQIKSGVDSIFEVMADFENAGVDVSGFVCVTSFVLMPSWGSLKRLW